MYIHKNKIRCLIKSKYIYFISVVKSDFENCDEPPQIANGQVKESPQNDDEADEIVAIYSCDEGYKLVGSAEFYCDLETDVWQGTPPSCQKGEPNFLIYSLYTHSNFFLNSFVK